MKREDVFTPGSYASIPKTIMALPSSALPAPAKLVWMSIVERFGKNDWSWPGAATLARDTGLTRRGVQLAVDRLQELKLITILPPDASHSSNGYACDWRTACASALDALAHGVRTPT
jgi:hypothetical protein